MGDAEGGIQRDRARPDPWEGSGRLLNQRIDIIFSELGVTLIFAFMISDFDNSSAPDVFVCFE